MNKRTLAALTTTATAAALVMSACSQAPSATPATSAKICAATSHADAPTDPAPTAAAGRPFVSERQPTRGASEGGRRGAGGSGGV